MPGDLIMDDLLLLIEIVLALVSDEHHRFRIVNLTDLGQISLLSNFQKHLLPPCSSLEGRFVHWSQAQDELQTFLDTFKVS